MAEFVDLQLQIHAKTAPMLTKLKDKLAKQINQLKFDMAGFCTI